MAVTSINISRVSHNMQTIALVDSLHRNTRDLFLQQVRISTGNRLNAPSDDPVLAAEAMELTQVLEQQDQILANMRHAEKYMNITDDAIGEVNDLLIQADSIASEMVNSTADQSQRDSMAELIKGIIDQLVLVGNRSYNGTYLFGGQETLDPPFTQTHGGVEYKGDTLDRLTSVSDTQDIAINLTGDELFGALAGRVSGSVDLNPAVTVDTRLSDLDGAVEAGIQRDLIRVDVSTPDTSFLVDLSNADTVGDVLDKINDSARQAGLDATPGGDFFATINPAGNGIQLGSAAGTITVSEVGEGVTARDLGLLGSGNLALNGGDLNARLVNTTRVVDLLGGWGANLGSIRIDNGSLSETIDLSGAETIQDVLNAINAADVEVEAVINDAGDGIDIISRMSGADLSVGEAGGGTATLLGIRTLRGDTRLSELNGGDGVGTVEGENDIRIIARNDTALDINLDGTETIQDVISAINAEAAKVGAIPPIIQASLAPDGNGIRIVDNSGGPETLRIERLNFSTAIDDLGLNKTVGTGVTEIVGDDVAAVEPDSVFSALIALHEALLLGGPDHIQESEITQAAQRISKFVDKTNRMQGVVGARSKSLTTRVALTEDAVLSTRELLSQVKDLDYTEGLTKFQQAQTALQANLMTGPRLMQMSLLDFLG
jgi:flagellin-like hook-associated protein FlgL